MEKKTKQSLLIVIAIVLVVPGLIHLGYYLIEKWQINRALVERHEIVLHPQRGKIYASDGRLLAYTDTVFSVHLDCRAGLSMRDSVEWTNQVAELAPVLDKIFPLDDTAGWQARIIQGREQNKRYLAIAGNLSKSQADTLKELPLLNLHPNIGGRIIEVHPRRIRPFGSLAGSTIGLRGENGTRTGLDSEFDYELYGSEGKKIFRTGKYEGRYIEKLDWIIPARNGSDLHTTLCVEKQVVADSILRNTIQKHAGVEGGTIVMMAVRTGAILVMANWKKTESGVYDIDNLAISRTISEIPESLKYIAPFSDGAIPDFDFDLRMKSTWNGGTLPGKGPVVTPLAILTLFNGLANGGQMVQPYLVGKIVDDDGNSVVERTPIVCGEIPATIADTLRHRMVSAGDDVGGIVGLSCASQDACTYAGFFPDDDPEYSVICTLFGNKKGPQWEMLPKNTVIEVINLLKR